MTTAVVFAYHDVGVRCLQVLLDAGVDVRLVVTHADDPAERVWFASVAALAKERALATLPPDFRAAVVLCDVEGLSYEEIAEILGAKLGTVRSRIHRGRALLRRALAHRAPATGRARYSGPLAAPLRPIRERA